MAKLHFGRSAAVLGKRYRNFRGRRCVEEQNRMLNEKVKVNIDKSQELTKLIGRRLREAYASWDAETIPPSIAGGIAKIRHMETVLADAAPEAERRREANPPRRSNHLNGSSD